MTTTAKQQTSGPCVSARRLNSASFSAAMLAWRFPTDRLPEEDQDISEV